MVARASGAADVVLRTVAATLGSYTVAALAAAALARTLAPSPVEAALGATLIALLLVLPVAAMACFQARSGWRACAGLAATGALFAAIAWAAR